MKSFTGYLFPVLGAAVPLANAAFGWHLQAADVIAATGALVTLGGLVAHVEASGNGGALLQQVQTALDDVAKVLGEIKSSGSSGNASTTTTAGK